MSNTLSRRSFIQSAAASALALGLPNIAESAVSTTRRSLGADRAKIQIILSAVSHNVRKRYQDRPELADETVAEIQQMLGHHTDLREFIFDAKTEAITDDVKNIATLLPFRNEIEAILREADHVRCHPVRQ